MHQAPLSTRLPVRISPMSHAFGSAKKPVIISITDQLRDGVAAGEAAARLGMAALGGHGPRA